jgi:L-ascorbate metabolism protein UlaG (beta-lactamase superfamily)
MKIGDIELKWLGHSGFLIEYLNKKIYIDPYQISNNLEKADLILITHSHHDHCSFEDIYKLIQGNTKVLMTADCQSKIVRIDIPIKMEIMEPNKEVTIGNLKIIGIPAYNKDKNFHPLEELWIGYLIKLNNTIIYHAGDTDLIQEMQKLTGHKRKGVNFIALLPVGGRFTMDAEEAVEAANIIKPDIAIPMHYNSIIGTQEDAQEFKELCEEKGIKCLILEKE